VTITHYLGITPKWVDGTAVGCRSFMIHVRHAAAAIASGLCETVLITKPRRITKFGYYGVPGLDTMGGGEEVAKAAGILG
jgi:acetyl-CoA acetyltransferase